MAKAGANIDHRFLKSLLAIEDSGLNNPFFSLSPLLRILVVLKLLKEEVTEGPKKNPFLHEADKRIRDILKSCLVSFLYVNNILIYFFKLLRTFWFLMFFSEGRFELTVMDRNL